MSDADDNIAIQRGAFQDILEDLELLIYNVEHHELEEALESLRELCQLVQNTLDDHEVSSSTTATASATTERIPQ